MEVTGGGAAQEAEPRVRVWRRRALLILLGLFAVFAVAEVGLRVLGISYPIFFRADRLAGTRLIPGAEGVYMQEGRADVRINDDGWRDPARAIPKPPNTFRIAVLGDSFTCALQVEHHETFAAIIKRQLTARGFRREANLEVLNFGVDGYGTAHELLTLRKRVWKYEPDLVLVAFFTGNDLWNNCRDLGSAPYMPSFSLENNELKLDDSFLENPAFRMRSSWAVRTFVASSQYIRLLQLVNRVRHVVRNSSRREKVAFDGPDGETEPRSPNRIYMEPADPAWEAAWRITERLLLTIRDECAERDVPFFLVTLTNAIQVDPDAGRRSELEHSLSVRDLFYAERRLQSLGEREGFPVLALAPEFQKRAGTEQKMIHGFGDRWGGHWNALGHRWAGERIATWLLQVAAK